MRNDDMMSTMMTEPTGSMSGMDVTAMQALVEACSACEQACTMCSASDMGMADRGTCCAMCANCADVCNTMMRMMMRPMGADMDAMMAMMQATMTMASACAAECGMHADADEQHRMCAQACREVVTACESMMASMKTTMA